MLLHGLSGSSRWWSKNFDALAARHLVAAVDLVGFGRNIRTVVPLIPPRLSEMTALLARWLESFGEPVHLVGHSMGGQIAIQLAAERPDLIRSLVLVSAVGMPFRLDPRPHVRSLPQPPYGGPGIARVLVPDFFRAGPASIAVAGSRILLGDLRPTMRELQLPVLLVWGAGDPLVPLHYGEEMQREIAGSRLVVIGNAAHVPMWDTPDEFNRTLLAFVDEIDATPRQPWERGFAWGIAGFVDGIAYRQAGPRRDFVLVHGMGMSSDYFARLARELFDRGWNPIAPDLPGFGESANAPAADLDGQARSLAAWADALGIRDALWLGHSTGCNSVARLARLRPDLVKRTILVGPLWSRKMRHPQLVMGRRLLADALIEPLSLATYVVPAYWRVGIWRWWKSWRLIARDLGCAPEIGEGAVLLAGERDPLSDDSCLRPRRVAGAHACNYSHPTELAEAIAQELQLEPRAAGERPISPAHSVQV